MANVIHKFILGRGESHIDIPGGKVLSVANQHDKACVWVELDNAKRLPTQKVIFVGTGIPYYLGDSKEFLGTVLLLNDNLVLHAFLLGDK